METLFRATISWLPRGLRTMATESRIRVLSQFIMFGTVGFFGLTLDTLTVYALRGPLGLYIAGVVAYCVGATGTWTLNRLWTFRGQGSGPAHRQWMRFLVANAFGFILNRGTYALVVTLMPRAAEQPVIATAAGAVVGVTLNFHLSRNKVFR